MRLFERIVVFLLVGFVAAGCSPLAGKPTMSALGEGVLVYSKDPAERAIYVTRAGSGMRMCLEPISDVERTSSEGLNLGVSTGGSRENIGETGSVGAMALGGLNPEIHLASMLLYRACELTANINADPALTIAVYEKFLEVIRQLAPLESGSGTMPSQAFGGASSSGLPLDAGQDESGDDDTIEDFVDPSESR